MKNATIVTKKGRDICEGLGVEVKEKDGLSVEHGCCVSNQSYPTVK